MLHYLLKKNNFVLQKYLRLLWKSAMELRRPENYFWLTNRREFSTKFGRFKFLAGNSKFWSNSIQDWTLWSLNFVESLKLCRSSSIRRRSSGIRTASVLSTSSAKIPTQLFKRRREKGLFRFEGDNHLPCWFDNCIAIVLQIWHANISCKY